MKFTFQHNRQAHPLNIERVGDEFQIEAADIQETAVILNAAPPRITFRYKGSVVTAHVAVDGSKYWVHLNGKTFTFEREDETIRRSRSRGTRQGTGSGIIVAPMPGQVRAVLVNQGDTVTEGQPLVLLEAMKMELKVTSPHAGIVANLSVAQGQSVEREQILGEITAQSDAPTVT